MFGEKVPASGGLLSLVKPVAKILRQQEKSHLISIYICYKEKKKKTSSNCLNGSVGNVLLTLLRVEKWCRIMAAIQGIEWHQRAITPVQLNFPNREQEPLDSLTTISYSNPCREISFQKEEVSIDQHFYFGFWLIFYINSETNIVALEIIFFYH